MIGRVGLLAAALLGLVAAAESFARSDPAGCLRPSDRAVSVRFSTPDGEALAGAVIGHGKTGIVFAHQVAGDRCQWLPFARELAAKGYRALVFDMRGYGTSAGVQNVNPDQDVVGATAELRRRGARRIVLIGASMGGTGVVAAAPRIRPQVSGVVELSAPIAFGGADARSAVRTFKGPVLFIAGRDDGDYASASRTLYRRAVSRAKHLVIAPTSWHGVDLIARPSVKKVVLDFIRRTPAR